MVQNARHWARLGSLLFATLLISLAPLWAVAQSATPIASPVGTESPGDLPPAWLQFGIDGRLTARAIVTLSCPPIMLDGRDTPMTVRAESTEDFPVVACEATVPFGVTSATILGQVLPLPDGPIERIAVIGDTGCRLDDWEKKYQACNDPASWPFAQVAASVAAWDPDLIIHVGDYLYRESPCPSSGFDCVGSPYGDNWATWSADYFVPASSLLGIAPWVLMRGNHETCDRNPAGWFRFLDPRSYSETCERFTEPYIVPVNGLTLAVIDSAEAADTKASPDEDAEYARQFDVLGRQAPEGSWLVTHRPVRGILEFKDGDVEVQNAAFEASSGAAIKGVYALVLSGHIHLAEAIAFESDSKRPPQIIAGNSGTALDEISLATPTIPDFGDPTIEDVELFASFGFLTIEPAGNAWLAVQRNAAGQPLVDCILETPDLRCETNN